MSENYGGKTDTETLADLRQRSPAALKAVFVDGFIRGTQQRDDSQWRGEEFVRALAESLAEEYWQLAVKETLARFGPQP